MEETTGEAQPIVQEAPNKELKLSSESSPGKPAGCKSEEVSFQIIYGKAKQDVTLPHNSKVSELKGLIQGQTGIDFQGQKLLLKGSPLRNDDLTLQQVGVKPGAKLMLIGTPATQVEAAKAPPPPTGNGEKEWDPATVPGEPISKQRPHAKILEKGKPEDATPGIKDKQVPLHEDVKEIRGLLNGLGTKIRLTFKPEMQQLWIGSAAATQKVPYGSVTKIEAFPIEGQEEYSIVAMHLGSGRYWLYWFPSQHVASLKIRILGLESLI